MDLDKDVAEKTFWKQTYNGRGCFRHVNCTHHRYGIIIIIIFSLFTKRACFQCGGKPYRKEVWRRERVAHRAQMADFKFSGQRGYEETMMTFDLDHRKQPNAALWW